LIGNSQCQGSIPLADDQINIAPWSGATYS